MPNPTIAITIGDPAGIGPEICEKALANPEIKSLAHYIVIGDRNSIPPQLIGRVSAAAGKASVEYVEKAIDMALQGKVDAIVTCPISKEAIHKAGYKYQGHTEILAKRTKTKNYAMLFVAKPFWVMLVTIHIPLKEVSRQLKKSEVLRIIKLAQATLIKAGVKQPRIGVAGLNPHAGENGILGKEEITIIAPAVAAALTAAGRAVLGLGPRFVHGQLPAFHVGAVKLLDGGHRFFVIGHFHEAEAPGLAAELIGDDFSAGDRAVRRKMRVQLLVINRERQTTYV